jgi:hypothetical protein
MAEVVGQKDADVLAIVPDKSGRERLSSPFANLRRIRRMGGGRSSPWPASWPEFVSGQVSAVPEARDILVPEDYAYAQT